MIDVGLTEHRLANGLRVIFAPERTVPVVAVHLAYGVGSANELPGRTGLAHLFEHLMFEGSSHVDPGEHAGIVGTVGGSVNGTTGLDLTRYFQTIPTEYLELILWLESDRMGCVGEALLQERLDNQRMVVKNEKLQREQRTPYGTAYDRISALVFPKGHPYHHTPIGETDDLDAATLEDARAFFETWYAPDNCALTIAGDIDPEHGIELVERQFGHRVARGAFPPRPDRTPLPQMGSEQRETIDAVAGVPAVFLGYRLPPAPDPALDALHLATVILASGSSSRLVHRLGRADRLANNISFAVDPHVAGASLAMASATAREGIRIEDVELAIDDEIGALTATGPTDAELRRAKRLTEATILETVAQSSSRARALSESAMLFGDPSLLLSQIDRVSRITSVEVRDAVSAYLHPENRAVVTFLPEMLEAV